MFRKVAGSGFYVIKQVIKFAFLIKTLYKICNKKFPYKLVKHLLFRNYIIETKLNIRREFLLFIAFLLESLQFHCFLTTLASFKLIFFGVWSPEKQNTFYSFATALLLPKALCIRYFALYIHRILFHTHKKTTT